MFIFPFNIQNTLSYILYYINRIHSRICIYVSCFLVVYVSEYLLSSFCVCAHISFVRHSTLCYLCSQHAMQREHVQTPLYLQYQITVLCLNPGEKDRYKYLLNKISTSTPLRTLGDDVVGSRRESDPRPILHQQYGLVLWINNLISESVTVFVFSHIKKKIINY